MSGGSPPTELKKDLSLVDSTLLVIGSMIGSAIFIVPSEIALSLGSPGYLLLIWVISGLVTLAAALSFGELAAMMPKAGGQYIYLREAYNPLTGFLYGWTFFTVIQTGSIAAIAVAFAAFFAVLFPQLGTDHIWLSFYGFHLSATQAVAMLSIVLLTAINIRGVHEGKLVQNVLTVIKMLSLFGLIFLGLVVGKNVIAIAANAQIFWETVRTVVVSGTLHDVLPLSGASLLTTFAAAMVGALFAMDAWNNITFTAGEVIHPRRTIPLSLLMGVLVVVVLYLLVNLAYLAVLPLRGDPSAENPMGRGIQFAANEQIGVAMASQVLGPIGASVTAFLIMIATFGCNNGLILSGARVFYAMAKDGLFFKSAGRLNAKASPSWALIWQGAWSCVLCLTGTYDQLLIYLLFAELIFYLLTVWGIFVLRRKLPDAVRPYRVFAYPFLPAFYILAAAAIALSMLLYHPKTTLPGLAIVAAGIPIYFLWKRFSKSELSP